MSFGLRFFFGIAACYFFGVGTAFEFVIQPVLPVIPVILFLAGFVTAWIAGSPSE